MSADVFVKAVRTKGHTVILLFMNSSTTVNNKRGRYFCCSSSPVSLQNQLLPLLPKSEEEVHLPFGCTTL